MNKKRKRAKVLRDPWKHRREGDDSKLSSDLEKLDLSQTGEPDPSNPAETDEAYDQFDINDLKMDNKGFRPFRDAGSSEEDSDQDDKLFGHNDDQHHHGSADGAQQGEKEHLGDDEEREAT